MIKTDLVQIEEELKNKFDFSMKNKIIQDDYINFALNCKGEEFEFCIQESVLEEQINTLAFRVKYSFFKNFEYEFDFLYEHLFKKISEDQNYDLIYISTDFTPSNSIILTKKMKQDGFISFHEAGELLFEEYDLKSIIKQSSFLLKNPKDDLTAEKLKVLNEIFFKSDFLEKEYDIITNWNIAASNKNETFINIDILFNGEELNYYLHYKNEGKYCLLDVGAKSLFELSDADTFLENFRNYWKSIYIKNRLPRLMNVSKRFFDELFSPYLQKEERENLYLYLQRYLSQEDIEVCSMSSEKRFKEINLRIHFSDSLINLYFLSFGHLYLIIEAKTNQEPNFFLVKSKENLEEKILSIQNDLLKNELEKTLKRL